MKTFFTGLAVCGLLVITGLPSTSQAYQTTGQSVRILTPTTALFTITYHFGFLNRELYLPTSAVRNFGTGTTTSDLEYRILTNGGTTTGAGVANGLVVSNATIKDGRYYLGEGKAADFTLIALLTIPASSTPSEYALSVSSLPFTLIDAGKTVAGGLQPNELDQYITPKIVLNAKPSTSAVHLKSITHISAATNAQ